MFPPHLFPKLAHSGYAVTSKADKSHNCIAFAVGDPTRWWWPIEGPAEASDQIVFWPAGTPLADSVDAFLTALNLLGYVQCGDASLDPAVDKITLYAIDGRVKHASRQMPNGRWRSKMGKAEDIEHELDAVEGPLYGQIAVVLGRPTARG